MGLGESFPRTTPSLQPPYVKLTLRDTNVRRPVIPEPAWGSKVLFSACFFVELSKAFEFDVFSPKSSAWLHDQGHADTHPSVLTKVITENLSMPDLSAR